MGDFYLLEKLIQAKQAELLAEAEHRRLVQQLKQVAKEAARPATPKLKENKPKFRLWPFSRKGRPGAKRYLESNP